MLLSDSTYINTNNRNYKKFIELGYTFNIGDRLMVKTTDLNTTSREFVLVKCDICNLEKSIMYFSYIQNTEKYNIYSCSSKCANIKFRKTNLERYGCEYPMQNKKIKEKVKEYFLSEYGVKHPSMLEEFELKKQNTNLEKYGVKHQMGLNENISKIKETKLEKYGDENYNNHEKSKETKLEKYDDQYYNNHEKSKETKLDKYNDQYYNNRNLYKENCLEKYGVTNMFVLDFIKEKTKKTNLVKYGVDDSRSSSYVINKRKKSNLEKYGVSSHMQVQEFFNKQQSSGFKIGIYNDVSYQGTYELDFVKFCKSNNIILHKPTKIKYIHNENSHYYFPDFFIEEYNLICEIKSSYYYKLDIDKNISKEKYSKELGYNFLFIIDKNYEDLKKIINKL